MTSRQLRENQVIATTAEEREEMDEKNPIIFAETAPSRFATLTLSFPEEDGVIISEDLDNQGEEDGITVKYFDQAGEVEEVYEGELYRWAVKYFRENWEG